MESEQRQFTVLMRILHWLMAAMVLTMLGIGVAMVASLGDYHRLSFHPPPVGDRHSDFGRDSLCESPVQYPAAISGNHVLAGALGRIRIRSIVVHVAVCAAAGWLGDVVGGAVSDRAVWAAASSPDSSAQRDVVRVSQEDAHRSRLPFVPGVHRAFWGDFVSHAHRARRDVQPDGAVAGFKRSKELIARDGPFDIAVRLPSRFMSG